MAYKRVTYIISTAGSGLGVFDFTSFVDFSLFTKHIETTNRYLCSIPSKRCIWFLSRLKKTPNSTQRSFGNFVIIKQLLAFTTNNNN